MRLSVTTHFGKSTFQLRYNSATSSNFPELNPIEGAWSVDKEFVEKKTLSKGYSTILVGDRSGQLTKLNIYIFLLEG